MGKEIIMEVNLTPDTIFDFYTVDEVACAGGELIEDHYTTCSSTNAQLPQ